MLVGINEFARIQIIPEIEKVTPEIANSLRKETSSIFNMTLFPGTDSSGKLLVNSFLPAFLGLQDNVFISPSI